MATARVEPPPGWGPKQEWLARLHRLGYTVAEWRVLGSSVLELS
jgi:hypothetical protein